MAYRRAGLGLALALASALPARGQSYPAPTFQGATILADPGGATQAARKGYVDTAITMGIAANVSGTITIAHGGTGQTTAAAALSALGGAPFNNPNLTGIVTVGAGPFVGDGLLPVQITAGTGTSVFFAANKAGAYGMLFGYDAGGNVGVVRNVTSDPINVITNNTTIAAQFTADGNTRFPGTATAATLRVGTTAGPTWTTGTGAPTATQPVGSLYSRTDGGIGSTFYVSHGGGVWNAVMGQ